MNNITIIKCDRLVRPGFTIVELLVVISIIALLIALLLPALARARQLTEGLACESNLRTLGQLTVEYSNTYKNALPASMIWPEYQSWQQDIFGFRIGSEVLDQNGTIGFAGYQTPVQKASLEQPWAAMFWCPSAILPLSLSAFGSEYAANANALSWWTDPRYGTPNPWPVASKVKRPADVIAYGDSNQIYSWGGTWPLFSWGFDPAENYVGQPWPPYAPSYNPTAVIPPTFVEPGFGTIDGNTDYYPGVGPWVNGVGLRYRHELNSTGNGYANAVFFDGHAQQISEDGLRQMNVVVTQ